MVQTRGQIAARAHQQAIQNRTGWYDLPCELKIMILEYAINNENYPSSRNRVLTHHQVLVRQFPPGPLDYVRPGTYDIRQPPSNQQILKLVCWDFMRILDRYIQGLVPLHYEANYTDRYGYYKPLLLFTHLPRPLVNPLNQCHLSSLTINCDIPHWEHLKTHGRFQAVNNGWAFRSVSPYIHLSQPGFGDTRRIEITRIPNRVPPAPWPFPPTTLYEDELQGIMIPSIQHLTGMWFLKLHRNGKNFDHIVINIPYYDYPGNARRFMDDLRTPLHTYGVLNPWFQPPTPLRPTFKSIVRRTLTFRFKRSELSWDAVNDTYETRRFDTDTEMSDS
ncbi:hypothetical protein BT63DRAFT_456759 [Microthyrium microscopicum]|uniref:Uncharacterized protein n=1 Tax=Microthyrium microscopicum TaxID=703497 RepID=A0A6A6U842_9PEZI|nr:hypothetical protein BT63DRAFT_456759 [Microthyrium microscopicum]